MGPFANPNEVYAFYSLPYCAPDQLQMKREDLGPLLKGDRPTKTLYDIRFRRERCRRPRALPLCLLLCLMLCLPLCLPLRLAALPCRSVCVRLCHVASARRVDKAEIQPALLARALSSAYSR